MAYFELPGVDPDGNFPPNVRQALVDSNEFYVEVQAAIDAGRGYGANLPAAQFAFANRQFFRTSDRTLWMGMGSAWSLIGGTTELGMVSIGALGTGFSYDTVYSSPYAIRDGRRLTMRAQFVRTSGTLAINQVLFQLSALFTPYSNGLNVVDAIHSIGPTGASSPLGVGVNGNGALVIVGTPAANTTAVNVQASITLP